MKYCKDFQVVENISITDNLFILKVQSSETLPPINAGQFVELQIMENENILLRRPISIHDLNKEKNEISLFVQIVGKGTAALSKLKTGNKINIIFPLGNGFTIAGNKVLLVGGGCGVAPLLYLARVLKEKNIETHILIGCKNINYLFSIDEYKALGNVYIATEDGSCGLRGMVNSHSIMQERFDTIYTCGPTPMMKEIVKIANKTNTPCYVSLENKMACGFGVCLCCVAETNKGNKRTCTTGPVFLSSELKEFQF